MSLPKVDYVTAFTITGLLICGIFLISLCIWRPGLLRRTFFGRGKKQYRFKKPKRRADKADYSQLQQDVPEEETLGSEEETHSRRKYPNIVTNVLGLITKRTLNIEPTNSSEALIMTRQKNGKKKGKKNKEEGKSGNDRGKADESKKQKISSILSCRSKKNAEVSGDEGTEDPANSWRETGATNINNDVYDKVGGRDHNEVSTVKVDPMPKDVVHRTFTRGRQQTIGDNGLLMQSTVRKEVIPDFERSPEEKTGGLYKTEFKAGTKMRTDHKQCINCTEKKQYSKIRDTQKTGPRGIHLKGHNWKEDKDHLLEDDSNSFRMLMYENLPVAANGNLGTDKQVNNDKWNSSTESSNDNNVTEISDRQDSKKETKNSSICSGDSLLEPNLGKHESTMIDCKYESLQKLSLDVDGEENMYNPINPLYENIYREPDVSLSTSLESVTVPLLIDEYANKEWRGGTVKAAQIRRGYSKVKEETGLICIRQIRGDNYCALRAVLFRTLSSGIDILGRFSKIIKIEELPRHLLGNSCMWLNNWSFANRLKLSTNSVVDVLSSCLHLLVDVVRDSTLCLEDSKRYQMILHIMNKSEEDEVKLFEAVKFLMLYSSVQLYNKMQNGEDVELLGALLFARDTSQDPESFMKNHLNCVGDVAGLDQLEMMLLGQTLNVVIKVFRLHRVDKDDFTVEFPNDLNNPEGTVKLVAEDDRHYNVLSEEA